MSGPSPVIDRGSVRRPMDRAREILLKSALPIMVLALGVILLYVIQKVLVGDEEWGFGGNLLSKVGLIGGPVVVLYVAVILMLLGQAYRRRRGMAVLSYVSQAVRLNLPLSPFLQAATGSECGTTAQRLGSLQAALSTGRPLADAMLGTVPELSPRIVELVAAGERSGRLSQTLERLMEQERKHRERRVDRRAYTLMYPAMLLFVVSMIVTLEMYFVVPKFREIFNDFRTTFPPVTQALFNASEWLGDAVGVTAGAFFVLLFVVYTSWVVGRASGRRGKRKRSRVRDALFWLLPLGNAWGRHRDMADALDVMDDGLVAGRPLTEAVGDTLGLDISWVLKRRFIRLHEALVQGDSLGKAAKRAGMPHLVATMLGTAETNGSLPEATAFLARYCRMRFSRAVILLHAAAEPAMVLCMGLVVGFVVLALFMPLAKLIASVAGMGEVL